MINGNMVGGTAPIKTVKIVDDDNNEFFGVVTGSEVIFTATDNDVREGFVYASNDGISTGTKIIPSYHTRYGSKIIPANTEVRITTPEYNYSNLLVVIATYDTSMAKSVLSTYVSVNNAMYEVGSATKLSDITVDEANEQINLGFTVTKKSVVRYLVTREES
jgi:hypothetical protein